MNLKQFIPAEKWYLSLLMGLFLGIGFPPFPAFFAFFIIPGLILALELCRRTTSTRELMMVSYPGFVVFNIITTYWLAFATIGGGVAAILANAVLMTLPLALMKSIQNRQFNTILKAFALASVWVFYEYLHHRWDLAWPWLTLGNAWSVLPVFIQYISFAGVLGISFWLVYTSSVIHDLTVMPRHNAPITYSAEQQRLRMLTLFTVFILPLLSVVQFYTFKDTPDRTIRLVATQPNFDSYLPLAGYNNPYTPLDELIALSDSASTPDTKLWLWPENGILANIHQNSTKFPNIELPELAKNRNLVIVGGANYYEYYRDHDVKPRYSRDRGNGERFNVYNAALAYSPDSTVSVYKKMSLVPLVERFPFLYILSRVKLPGLDWDDLSGFARGYDAINFTADGVLFPALVCYDSVFPARVQAFATQGAGFLSVITNDGWWGNTSGHVQHYDFARLRAIEHRRAVVRSANNGTSGMILPNGTVHSRSKYWTKTALKIDVPVYSKQTIYTRFGDNIMLIIILAGLLTGGRIIIRNE